MKCAIQHESGFILSVRLYYISRMYLYILQHITQEIKQNDKWIFWWVWSRSHFLINYLVCHVYFINPLGNLNASLIKNFKSCVCTLYLHLIQESLEYYICLIDNIEINTFGVFTFPSNIFVARKKDWISHVMWCACLISRNSYVPINEPIKRFETFEKKNVMTWL